MYFCKTDHCSSNDIACVVLKIQITDYHHLYENYSIARPEHSGIMHCRNIVHVSVQDSRCRTEEKVFPEETFEEDCAEAGPS